MRDLNADLQALIDTETSDRLSWHNQLDDRTYVQILTDRIHRAGVASYDEFYRLIRSQDGDLEARKAASEVLGRLALGIRIGGVKQSIVDKRRALPALLDAASSPDSRLRSIAAEALGRLRTKGAFQKVYELAFADDEATVRWTAIRILGQFKDKRPLHLLIPLAQNKNAFPLERIFAIIALHDIGDQGAVPVLLAIMEDENDDVHVRAHATEWLAHFGEAQTVSAFTKMLNHESAELRFWAAFGLVTLTSWVDTSVALPQLDHTVAHDKNSIQHYWHVGREALPALSALWYQERDTDKIGQEGGTYTCLISPLLEYADFQRASWRHEGEEYHWQPLEQSTTLRLDPIWLSEQLKKQWQGIRFDVIKPQPESLLLNWEIDMLNGLLLGGLHRDGYSILLTNQNYDEVLTFAVWYRSIISSEHTLRLYEWADPGREILPDMTVDELKAVRVD